MLLWQFPHPAQCVGSTHAPFTFLYREHAGPRDFSLGCVFVAVGSFLKKKDHEEDQPASRQCGRLGRMARRSCRHGRSENRENRAKISIWGGWQGGRVDMAQWKLANIAPNRCLGVDCKASVSPWCAGQQWNHLKYILEVVPAWRVRAGYLLLGHRRGRDTNRTASTN